MKTGKQSTRLATGRGASVNSGASVAGGVVLGPGVAPAD